MTAPEKIDPPLDFAAMRRELDKLPPETPEEKAEREAAKKAAARGERVARFKRVCPAEFSGRVNHALLTNSEAFAKVTDWDGSFPGPLASGPTGRSKTRAAWSLIGRKVIEENKTLAWFPVKRLLTEFARYENKDHADEFWKFYRNFDLLFVDDLDKINWQFESEMQALFQFYDWVYRDHRPCITTTNKDRAWWVDKMGDAFARRLFDDAHFAVKF